MKKRSERVSIEVPPDIQRALNRFPSIVKQKSRRYRTRRKFLRDTFGEMVRQVRREERRSRAASARR